MKIESFVAGSAAEALAQIKDRLGPDAVVLDVRKLPSEGFGRLFQKQRIEVLAYGPGDSPLASPETGAPVDLVGHEDQVPEPEPAPRASRPGLARIVPREMEEVGPRPQPSWQVGVFLEKLGFIPLYAQQVVERLRHQHGEKPPPSLAEEFNLARLVLADWWHKRTATCQTINHPLHVFIGPAGTGKTTALCKWLTKAVLMEGRRAQVWRLDGRTVNTAETLSVYGEILGVPVERTGPVQLDPSVDVSFVDLPGVTWSDSDEMSDLKRRLTEIPAAQVHLVLNGAYELTVLQAQARSFAHLPVTDLIITHLEEETRWTKLWNLVLGTNFSIRYLSAGQNIPGEFFGATPEVLLSRQFPK